MKCLSGAGGPTPQGIGFMAQALQYECINPLTAAELYFDVTSFFESFLTYFCFDFIRNIEYIKLLTDKWPFLAPIGPGNETHTPLSSYFENYKVGVYI